MSKLQHQILKLSVAERLNLISFIANSISEEAMEAAVHVPEEWLKTALAREANYAANPAGAKSWEAVKAALYGKKY